MATIVDIHAREIIDSRGNPTVEVDVITENGKSINIKMLISLISGAKFIIANDTGPAHIAAHIGAHGLTLFGQHTTATKVSIETVNFKAIQVSDLSKLSAGKVMEKILI